MVSFFGRLSGDVNLVPVVHLSPPLHNIWLQLNSNNISALYPYNFIQYECSGILAINIHNHIHGVGLQTYCIYLFGGLLTRVERLRATVSGSRGSGDCTVLTIQLFNLRVSYHCVRCSCGTCSQLITVVTVHCVRFPAL